MTSQDIRPLGRAGLRVGPHSFGTAALGNLFTAVTTDVALDAVNAAWERGIRYFDTAPHYGLGLAEERLGEALASRPREEFIVSSKVGRRLVDTNAFLGEKDDDGFDVVRSRTRVRDYTRDGVLWSIEDTLARTGLDRLDIVLVHDPDDFYAEAMDGAFPALEELRSAGVITSYGAGMNQSAMLTKFVLNTDLDVVMVAGRYTPLDQTAETDLLPAALSRGVSVVAAGVFNSGLLATDRPQPGAHYSYAAPGTDVLRRAEALADVCSSLGLTTPVVAAQYPLRHPAVATVCLGARSRGQVERNADLFSVPVPPEAWDALEAAGFLSGTGVSP